MAQHKNTNKKPMQWQKQNNLLGQQWVASMMGEDYQNKNKPSKFNLCCSVA